MEVYIVVSQNYDTSKCDVIVHDSTTITLYTDAYSAACAVASIDEKRTKEFFSEIKKVKTGETRVIREYITSSLTEKYQVSVTKKILSLSNNKMLSHEIQGCYLMGGFNPESHLDEIEKEEYDEEE